MENKHKAWDKVLLARHPKRPTAISVVKALAPDFIEFKGDRLFANDYAIIGGIGTIGEYRFTIIAEEKGTNLDERIKNHFGMPHPEGYRKVMRLVRQAEKFNRPVLFLIDTPGAYPGIDAEARGQAEAIASSLRYLFTVKVPLIAAVLSEGGSGGALAIGIADYLLMFENATYSILSPEGFAAILYKDAALAIDVADTMKLTAQDLKGYGIVDEIIPEQAGGWHVDKTSPIESLKQAVLHQQAILASKNTEDLIKDRTLKYRRIGVYKEGSER